MLLALAWVARQVDWDSTLHALAQLGARAPLVALPYAVVLSFDTAAWNATFERSARIPFWALWRLRAAGDCVANSLPAGPALAEALKALVLQRTYGMELSDAAANLVLTKVALAISQGLFLIAGVAAALPTLRDNSPALMGRAGLEWIGIAIALGFFSVMCLALFLLSRDNLLTGLTARWARSDHPRWQSLAPRLAKLATSLGIVKRIPRRQLLSAIGLFLCGWLVLGFENFVILTLLSSGVSLSESLCMEALVSVIRIAFFFVPSALGAQEVGYFMLLRAFGVADPVVIAAAFTITKRTKELFWFGIGYLMLWSSPRTAYARESIRM